MLFKTSPTWRILIAVKDTYLQVIGFLCLGLAGILGWLTFTSFIFGGMDTYNRQLVIICGLLVVAMMCIVSISEETLHMKEYYSFRGDTYPSINWFRPALFSVLCALITAVVWSVPSNFMSFSSLLGPIPVAPWHGGELQLTFSTVLGSIGFVITLSLGILTRNRVAIELEDYRTGRAGSF